MFEVHQPLRLNRNFHLDLLARPPVSKKDLFELYFDNTLNKHIFDRAARKCYYPANNIILKEIERFKLENKKFKVSYGISGVFIEQCKSWNPGLLESFKQLGQTGCVEFLGETYYHSLASLFGVDRSEFVEQVKMMNVDIITTIDANFYWNQPLFITLLRLKDITIANRNINKISCSQIGLIPPMIPILTKNYIDFMLKAGFKIIGIPMQEINKDKEMGIKSNIFHVANSFKKYKNFKILLISTSPTKSNPRYLIYPDYYFNV